jgi:hypothetical protein
MRRWLSASVQAASAVADRSSLWLPGALAWMVTVGWLALLLGVARPPTIAELTFLGAGIVTSGQWPWNGIAILAATVVLTATAIALASVAEAALLRGRRVPPTEVRRTFLVGVVCVVPLGVAVAALVVALSFVAPGEFNAPEPGSGGGPLFGTLVALGPILAVALLAAVIGGAIHAAATRSAGLGDGAWSVLRAAPATLGRAGTAAIGQVLALLVARIAYLALTVILLRVLWAPIDDRLSGEGFGLAVIGLLVGFVAIWLCLVLAGGALHAWGALSWTRLLDTRGSEAGAVAQMESRSRP